MNRFHHCGYCAMALIVFLLSGAASAAEPTDEKWQSLFDGQSLKGWVQRGGEASYRVEDQCIVGQTGKGKSNSFLCTAADYADFVLELEFKVDSSLNSGIQIRSHSFDHPTKVEWQGKKSTVPTGRVHGYQVEIDPSARSWTGGIYDEGRRGWLNDLKNNEAARKALKKSEWNKLRVECRKDSIKTWLNDVPAADLRDSMTPTGFIALQVHAHPKEGLEVRWRNIRLQDLGETK